MNKVFDGLDVLKNSYIEQKKQARDHSLKLKREVSQKTNYLISMLQSREKLLCEQIDSATNTNMGILETQIESTKSSMEKVSTFLDICEDWGKIPVDNALLQLKPMLCKRLDTISEHSCPERRNVELITWSVSNYKELLGSIQEFGDVDVTKTCLRLNFNF